MFARKRLPSFFHRKRSDKVRRDLEDAVRDTSRNSSSPISSSDAIDCTNGIDISGIDCELHSLPPTMSMNPTNVYAKFEAHDGEVSAVRWCPTEKIIATGGADRKLKLWDVRKSKNIYYIKISSFYGIYSIMS